MSFVFINVSRKSDCALHLCKNYHSPTEDWDKSIPKKGKEAEKGCVGCAWYDIETWRNELIKKLK